jgi:hypothetical protein
MYQVLGESFLNKDLPYYIAKGLYGLTKRFAKTVFQNEEDSYCFTRSHGSNFK